MIAETVEWLNDSDVEGARQRAEAWRDQDPFPNIPPSLLGFSAILDYVRVTGMIHPFRGWNSAEQKADFDLVKPASYEIRPGVSFYWFDKSGDLQHHSLIKGERGREYIHLPANSITFVSTEETLRLPNYIAARFNLRIKHVHRGILLGTGPLVDPGYDLPILIPLHNLTSEDYFIGLDEGLIWVEFTKIYPSPKTPDYSNNYGKPKLPEHTKKDFKSYLFKAGSGTPIRSSIPAAIEGANTKAQFAEKKVVQLDQRIRNLGIVGILAVLLTVASILIPVFDLVLNTNEQLEEMRKEVQSLKAQLAQQEFRAEPASARPESPGNE